jgi:hypothetical protein
VSAWDQLSPEQYAVMINAVDEAALVDVMDEYRARIRWAEAGSTLVGSDLTDDDKRALMPRFAAIVADMVSRGWIELADGLPTPDSRILNPAEIAEALRDSYTWIRREDEAYRLVGVFVGEAWEELIKRDPPRPVTGVPVEPAQIIRMPDRPGT